jgi:DNA ligase-1
MPAANRRALLVVILAGAAPWPPVRAAEAPTLVLPALWSADRDPARYLVSEKYDGVRAFWDGRVLRHRSGWNVNALAWFTARLPADPLDGELWLGRGRFDALSAIVRRQVPVDAEWRQLCYVVFELPGGAADFAQRAQRIAAIVVATGWPARVAAEQCAVADRAALHGRLACTVAAGGEGLVLHRADAAYCSGRSDALLKLKPELDTEATVIGHPPRARKVPRAARRFGTAHARRPAIPARQRSERRAAPRPAAARQRRDLSLP